MTVKDLMKILNGCDPNAIVLVHHPVNFVPVISVESFPVWKADNEIWSHTYVDNFQKGLKSHLAGEAQNAVYLNAIPRS